MSEESGTIENETEEPNYNVQTETSNEENNIVELELDTSSNENLKSDSVSYQEEHEEEEAEEGSSKITRIFDDILSQSKSKIANTLDDGASFDDVTSLQSRYEMACKKYKVLPLKKCMADIDKSQFDLSDLNIGRKAFKPVVEALFFSQTLNHLIIPGNRLGAEGLHAVSYVFFTNTSISLFNYANNCVGPNGGEFISKILRYGLSLECLDLSQNEMDDQQLMKFLPSLKENTKLKDLNLSDNDFSASIGKELGQCLANNMCLQKLNFGYNILKEGASTLFAALRANSGLRILNLSGNEIGEECAPDLGKALDANKSLEELDLSYNRLTSESMPPISKGVKSNNTLKIFNLEYNPLFAQGASLLINSVAAADNKIEHLNLSGVRVNLNFLKTVHVIKSSGRAFEVKYGNRTQCEFCTKFDKTLWKEDKPLFQVLQLADASALDLKTVLQKIHAKFLSEYVAALPKQEDSAPKKSAENSQTSGQDGELLAERYPRMEASKFAAALSNSSLKVPQEIAETLAESFADEKSTVDVGEIIALIPLRIGEVEYEVVKPQETAEKPKKKK